jgi:hypothetical protein
MWPLCTFRPRRQVTGNVAGVELWADERPDAFALDAAPWRTGAPECRIIEVGAENAFGRCLQLL